MGTEDLMVPSDNVSKDLVIDLKEVYLKVNRNIQLSDISENQRICRFCVQLVTDGFVSLNDVDIDVINMYIPQIVSTFQVTRMFVPEYCILELILQFANSKII